MFYKKLKINPIFLKNYFCTKFCILKRLDLPIHKILIFFIRESFLSLDSFLFLFSIKSEKLQKMRKFLTKIECFLSYNHSFTSKGNGIP